jgi:hypothetical protein
MQGAAYPCKLPLIQRLKFFFALFCSHSRQDGSRLVLRGLEGHDGIGMCRTFVLSSVCLFGITGVPTLCG